MKRRGVVIYLASTIALALVGCGGGTGGPAPGSEGGPCYGNGTCDAGLACGTDDICHQTEANPCQGVDCSGHGTCAVDADDNALCVCDDGYHRDGLACLQDDLCAGVDCSGHGTCDAGSCTCDQGYAGAACDSCAAGYHDNGSGNCVEDVTCQANSCNGHGTCDDTGGEVVCTCSTGYSGDYCGSCAAGYHDNGSGNCVEDVTCQANSCNGHGTCDDSGGEVVCTCNTGYSGDFCGLCAAGYHDDGSGNCIVNVTCQADSCSGHGTCDDSTGVIACTCDTGYAGQYCDSCDAGYHDDGSGSCVADDVACDFSVTTRMHDMPVALRTLGSTEAVNGKIYILGGSSEPISGNYAYQRNVYEYDIASDSFRDLGEILPYGLNVKPYNIARADNGKFYIGPVIGTNQSGGWGSHSKIIEFDPIAETAVEKADFGSVLWDMNAVNGGDGYIYFFGAWNGGSVSSIWRYDPVGDSIATVAVLPKAGNSVYGIIRGSNGLIYASGNQYGSNFLVFDPSDYSMHTVSQPCTTIGPIIWEAPTGTLWSFCDRSTLVSFDMSNETFTTHDLGGDIYYPAMPQTYSVDYSSGTLFAFGGKSTTADRIANVYRHDCLIHQTSEEITISGRSVRGIAYESGYLWVTHGAPGSSDYCKIAKIEISTGSIVEESNELRWNGRGITIGAGSLWVTDAMSDVIHRVDPATLAETNSFGTPGTEPCGITFDGTNLWLVDPWFQKIYELSTSGSVLSNFSVPNEQRMGMEWEGTGIWTDTDMTEISHYTTGGSIDDTATINNLPADSNLWDVAIGGGKIYITTGSDTIYVQNW